MKIWLSKQFELEEWRRRMVFWGGAVATGSAAVLFAKGSDFAMALFFKARAWTSCGGHMCRLQSVSGCVPGSRNGFLLVLKEAAFLKRWPPISRALCRHP